MARGATKETGDWEKQNMARKKKRQPHAGMGGTGFNMRKQFWEGDSMWGQNPKSENIC